MWTPDMTVLSAVLRGGGTAPCSLLPVPTMASPHGLFAATLLLALAAHLASSCGDVVPRKGWRAKYPKQPEKIKDLPVPYVVIHHTYIPGPCNTTKECKASMRAMQSAHQNNNGWSDIGYNFCIGGDGRVYEGRGWGMVGAHAPVYNFKSVGICFIGDFRTVLPSRAMLDAAQELIECGIDEGFVDDDYALVGHRQVRRTECPGDALYRHIQTWQHWTDRGVSIVERTKEELERLKG